MNDRTDHEPADTELDASLRSLGVSELEERLEFSPLLAGGGQVHTDVPSFCCSCKIPPDDILSDPLPTSPTDPGPVGSGSTGPTGGLGW